jgi:hypothetical protein
MNVKDLTSTTKWNIAMAYCDYIASVIRKGMVSDTSSPLSYIKNVSGVHYDLHPNEGYMMSTAKTIVVEDKNGKHYRVTVEEMTDDN